MSIGLELVVDAGTGFLVSGQKRGGGHMGGMTRVDIDVGHCGDDGSEYHIPSLGGILVDTDLHRLEYINLLRQCQERILETASDSKTLLGSTVQFECYNMLDHDA